MHCGKGVRMLLIISWKVSLWGGGWGVRVAGFFFGGGGSGYRKVRVPFRVSSLPFLRRAGPKPRLSVWGGEVGGRGWG